MATKAKTLAESENGGVKTSPAPQAPGPNQGKKDPPVGLKPTGQQTANPTGAPAVIDQKDEEILGKLEGAAPGKNHKRPADQHIVVEGEDEGEEGSSDADEITEKALNILESYETRKKALLEGETFNFKIATDASGEMKQLFEGTEMNEESVDKIGTIFEAAVREATKSQLQIIVEAFDGMVKEALAEGQEFFLDQIDSYLTYAVNEWTEQNKLAIVSGLRAERAEYLMEGLRDLLAECYVDVPEEKVDLVEGLNAKVEEAQNSLNEQIDRNVSLTEQLVETQKELALTKFTIGMTDVDAARVRQLAEGVDFVGDEEFVSKLTLLKESFITNKKPRPALNESQVSGGDADALNEDVAKTEAKSPFADPMVDLAVSAISRYGR